MANDNKAGTQRGTGARIATTARQIADKASGGQRGSGITKGGGRK